MHLHSTFLKIALVFAPRVRQSLGMDTRSQSAEFKQGYNDAYADATIRGYARLTTAGTQYALGYAKAWRVYGGGK